MPDSGPHLPTHPKLFQPIKVGNITLSHRVAFAPCSRVRANKAHVHGDMAVEYYTQRASVPGTLLITEATFVSQEAGGFDNLPGIYTEDQILAWKKIADSVHAKGSFLFMQIWALGRAAYTDVLKSEDPSLDMVSSSNLKLSNRPDKDTPRALSIPEIHQYAKAFALGASNAIHKAGLDGVEIHAAHGYLIDQFTQSNGNKRTDEYGGSVENRCRFALEIVDAVTKAVGQERVGIRLSPWSRFQDMRMDDPFPTFTYLVTALRDNYPNLAYISLVEPRISGADDDDSKPPIDPRTGLPQVESNDFLREIWAPRPVMSAGYRTRDDVIQGAEKGDIIAKGRYFISNPDLPLRIKHNIPWTKYNRSSFYTPEDPVGYIDYPMADPALYASALEGEVKA